jgi:molybdopterin-containing oxidoreductase family membrane subunit
MLEKALKGGRGYWIWISFLLAVTVVGIFCYLQQLEYGLGITGMSRDVSWGLYIAQFTFLVGIAASAVVLVLPYYLHDYKAFGKITVLGEFLAVAAVIMSITFIFVNLGQPARVFFVPLYASFTSVLVWDMMVLFGYLLINIITGWVILSCQRKEVPPPGWIKPLIYLSIPWAVCVHTVTAFIYAGLPGRSFWLTAIMAPRFLAAAFASGSALMVIIGLVLKRFGRFDAGEKAIQALARIIAYALAVSIFFVFVELFTVFYSQVPEHMRHFQYLFTGLEGHHKLVPWMWTSAILAFAALTMLLITPVRRREGWLAIACVFVFVSLWIEKGLGLVIPGFIPSPLEAVTEYMPTGTEVGITLGVWAIGFLILTLLYKIFIGVQSDVDTSAYRPVANGE